MHDMSHAGTPLQLPFLIKGARLDIQVERVHKAPEQHDCARHHEQVAREALQRNLLDHRVVRQRVHACCRQWPVSI